MNKEQTLIHGYQGRPTPEMGTGGHNLQKANQVHVFCAEYERGLCFYDQSPYGSVAELAGSLPEGEFWSSRETDIPWDDSINGERKAEAVTNEVSIITNKHVVREINGGSYAVTTIMVTKDVMDSIVRQISAEKPAMSPDGNYKLIKFGTRIQMKKLDKENNTDKDLNGINHDKYDYEMNDINDFHI